LNGYALIDNFNSRRRPYTNMSRSDYQPVFKNISRRQRLNQGGFLRGLVLLLILAFAIFAVFRLVASHASADGPAIESGVSGYCLDIQNEKISEPAVSTGRCSGVNGNDWTISDLAIKHGTNECLAVQADATVRGAAIVANTCSQAPGQVWLRNQGGYKNPNSDSCLSLPDGQTGQQLVLAACAPTQPTQTWKAVTGKPNANGQLAATPSCAAISSEGPRVACYAEQEWTTWQSGSPSHNTLLNNYSDGNGYEEWCADFVSYAYKEAGYPFSNGERDNWDEYLADDVQYDGNFTVHQAGSYTPQPGDIAYFDYPGGHVEIVVGGGPTPTFIYGDSGTVDPATGNGDMATNTITSDGAAGQVMYYLSPN
jgi:hypothetical protein